MSNLNDLYAASTTKLFVVQSSELTCMIQKQIDNSKYLAIPLITSGVGLVANGLFIVLDGTQAIWTAV